ncbi:hypothetical protein SLEP1_g24729 [Rubroshorea leprosula]|uniref:Uncharacterized protein n=1 Tax=Rubroshorea leprosula TaxID=152421 RepID=A0AAV5JNU9_9ROSI|nr:hypothetical protein SLEP1_g24729 [Rubroshorea leprosula]
MMARACRGIIAGSGAQQGKQSAGDLVQSAGAGAEQSWCRKQGRAQQSAGWGRVQTIWAQSREQGRRCRAGAARLGVRGGDDGSVQGRLQACEGVMMASSVQSWAHELGA